MRAKRNTQRKNAKTQKRKKPAKSPHQSNSLWLPFKSRILATINTRVPDNDIITTFYVLYIYNYLSFLSFCFIYFILSFIFLLVNFFPYSLFGYIISSTVNISFSRYFSFDKNPFPQTVCLHTSNRCMHYVCHTA